MPVSIFFIFTIFFLQIPRGTVQNLMQSASSFSWNVLRFCEELEELWSVKAILTEFAPRLAHCCEAELLPLMDLPAIKRVSTEKIFVTMTKRGLSWKLCAAVTS